jgi:hypothetical protein
MDEFLLWFWCGFVLIMRVSSNSSGHSHEQPLTLSETLLKHISEVDESPYMCIMYIQWDIRAREPIDGSFELVVSTTLSDHVQESIERMSWQGSAEWSWRVCTS